MAAHENAFDPQERRREKDLARRQDESRLRQNQISPQDLGRENSIFGALDLSRSIIIRRKARIAR